jgi:adenylosuccinate synthase
MQNACVIDLGYGGSGVGQVIDWLMSTFEYSSVAKYNGGPQAEETVKFKNKSGNIIAHDFQTFGSGTFREFSTILLPSVVFDPILLWKEFLTLKEKTRMGSIRMLIDYHSPVITPYDVYMNLNSSKNLEDGTCGKGVFVTKQREKNHHHLHAIDLLYPDVLALKLQALKKAYQFPIKTADGQEYDVDLTEFLHCVDEIVKSPTFMIRSISANNDIDSNIVFESSQGLMLDENIGIFPHCSPSKVDIPDEYKVDKVYLVTKAYHTRHGNGPLTTEKAPVSFSGDISKSDAYRGSLRSGILDLDVLCYALESSNICDYLVKNKDTKLHLVVTHMQDIKDGWCYKRHNEVISYKDNISFVKGILREIELVNNVYEARMKGVYMAEGEFKDDISEIKENINRKVPLSGPPSSRRIRTREDADQAMEPVEMVEPGNPGGPIAIDNETSGLTGRRAIFGNDTVNMRDVTADFANAALGARDGAWYDAQTTANTNHELTESLRRSTIQQELNEHMHGASITDNGPEFDGAGNANSEFNRAVRNDIRTAGLELAEAFATIDAESDRSIIEAWYTDDGSHGQPQSLGN